MDVVVCVKRVPDTETKVRVAPDGKSLDPSGVQWIMAPYDEMAVEKALRLRDGGGGGTVTVVTVGPPEASKELRTALAMGADKAVHVTAPGGAGDALSTAKALAAVIRALPFDLVLCGKQATDEDDAAVGPMLAALLDVPCVAFAVGIEVAGKTATVRREVEGELEVLEVALPAVATAQKGLAEARLPGLKGIMAAKKKPLEEKPLASVLPGGPAPKTETRSLSLPPARAACRKFPATPEGVKALFQTLRTERGVL
jgi:electron transfer flavoprotein beta subunit